MLCSAMTVASSASAHMMPPQNGTLNVLGDAVYTVLMLPAAALRGADDDGDGRLSYAEVVAHEQDLGDQVAARLRLFDAASGPNAGTVEFVSVRAEHDDSGSETSARHVLVLMKTRFSRAPRLLGAETDLFGGGAGEDTLQLRATRGAEAEVGILRAEAPRFVFFGVPSSESARGHVIGATLGGLALVLVAARGVRAARATSRS